MASVIGKIVAKAAKGIAKWGVKNWNKIVSYVKAHWKEIGGLIIEMGVWEVIEYVAELLGL